MKFKHQIIEDGAKKAVIMVKYGSKAHKNMKRFGLPLTIERKLDRRPPYSPETRDDFRDRVVKKLTQVGRKMSGTFKIHVYEPEKLGLWIKWIPNRKEITHYDLHS